MSPNPSTSKGMDDSLLEASFRMDKSAEQIESDICWTMPSQQLVQLLDVHLDRADENLYQFLHMVQLNAIHGIRGDVVG